MAKQKKKPVLITTPYPTTKEVAKILGVSEKRRKQIESIIDETATKSTKRKKRASKK